MKMGGSHRDFLMKRAAAKPKFAAVKPKAASPPTPAPSFFNQAGKPDPEGDYDKEGFMVRVPGKRTKFTKPFAPPADTEAAKRAGFKR